VITVAGVPNLTPYQLAGRADKIIVARATGATNTSPSLTTADTLYVGWAAINNGTATASNSFSINLYVDGVLKNTWSTSLLATNASISATDYSIGSLSAGSHAVSITVDATGTI